MGNAIGMGQQGGNTTTAALPESGNPIILNKDGGVTPPAGSTVQTGSGLEIAVNGDGAQLRRTEK